MGVFEHSHGPGGNVIRKGVETFATATPISEAGAEIINKLKKFKDMASGFLNFYTFAILIGYEITTCELNQNFSLYWFIWVVFQVINFYSHILQRFNFSTELLYLLKLPGHIIF